VSTYPLAPLTSEGIAAVYEDNQRDMAVQAWVIADDLRAYGAIPPDRQRKLFALADLRDAIRERDRLDRDALRASRSLPQTPAPSPDST